MSSLGPESLVWVPDGTLAPVHQVTLVLAPPASSSRPSFQPVARFVRPFRPAAPVIPPAESTSSVWAIRSVGAGLTTRSSEQPMVVYPFCLVFSGAVAELGFVRRRSLSAMKRLLDLTNEDLAHTPVWLYRGASDDSAVVSPASSFESADEHAYIARTHFVFADGSQGWGYCSPTEDSGLDYIQPVFITPAGHHMRFWRDYLVDAAELRQQVRFPVHFECVVPFRGQQLRGTITGFVTASA